MWIHFVRTRPAAFFFCSTGLKYNERNQTMWHHNSHKLTTARQVPCSQAGRHLPPYESGVRLDLLGFDWTQDKNHRFNLPPISSRLKGVHLLKSCVSVHLFVCAVFNPEDRDATLLPHTSSVAEARSKVSPAGLWTMTGGKHLLLLLLAGQAKVL